MLLDWNRTMNINGPSKLDTRLYVQTACPPSRRRYANRTTWLVHLHWEVFCARAKVWRTNDKPPALSVTKINWTESSLCGRFVDVSGLEVWYAA